MWRQHECVKLKAWVAFSLGLLAQDPPAHQPVTMELASQVELASQPRQRDSASSCGNFHRVLRFEMLSVNAEPPLPANEGLPVCLAVYHIPGPVRP